MSSGPLEVAGAVAAGKIDHAAENNNQGGFFLSSPAPLLASANAIRLIDDASAELKIRISSTNSLCSMDSNYTDVSVSPGVSPTLEPSPPLEPRSVSYEARLSMIDEAESKPMKLGCYDSSDEEELEKLEGASIICGSEVLPSTLSHGSIREPLHNLAPKPQHDQVPRLLFSSPTQTPCASLMPRARLCLRHANAWPYPSLNATKCPLVSSPTQAPCASLMPRVSLCLRHAGTCS